MFSVHLFRKQVSGLVFFPLVLIRTVSLKKKNSLKISGFRGRRKEITYMLLPETTALVTVFSNIYYKLLCKGLEADLRPCKM